jgi:DNA-binding transcriptional MerR regulator
MTGTQALMQPRWRQLGLLTVEEVAARCALHPELVRRLMVLGLIDPEAGAGELFRPEVTLRIQRILRLRRDLGMNYNAVALVLDLLDRIETLETRLHHFEDF